MEDNYNKNDIIEKEDISHHAHDVKWEPGPPPEDGSPPDYYTAISEDLDLADVPPPPEYTQPDVQGLSQGTYYTTINSKLIEVFFKLHARRTDERIEYRLYS